MERTLSPLYAGRMLKSFYILASMRNQFIKKNFTFAGLTFTRINPEYMKLKNLLLFIVVFLSCYQAQAQNKKTKSGGGGDTSSAVLFTVGDEKVTVDEFRYIYEKNNSNDKNLYTDKNLRDYLDLFTKFKLKVKEAHEVGLDTTKKFLQEYISYRDQLAIPYLTDREVTQRLVDESYERLKTELRASHILIGVSPDASPKDSLKAYNRAMKIREAILKGTSFDRIARDSSDDPSVANNGGDLGYFTAFYMIYPFESGAYNLKNLGDISMPVRTRFGYHIIKLTDRRPYRGEIQVRHIMINSAPNDPIEKQKIAKNKVDSLYSLLKKGVSFAELARQYSDHVQSRNSGGELPWFNSFASFPEEFKDHAFALKANGDFTEPFKSNFGWHLIQRVEYKPLQNRKEMEDFLKNRISRDSRSEKSRDAALAKFKKDFGYKEKKKALKRFMPALDSNLVHGNWVTNNKVKAKKVMFVIGKKEYTQADFAKFLEANEKPDRFTEVPYAAQVYLKNFEDQEVMNTQNQSLEAKFPEFRNIAKEYKEGILLFEITETKVWNKAMSDSTGRKAFFAQNQSKYWWKPRAEGIIIDLRDKTAVPDIMNKLKLMDEDVEMPKAAEKPKDKKADKATGAKDKKDKATEKKAIVQLPKRMTIDSISNGYVKTDPLSFNYKKLTAEKGENNILDTVNWKPGIYDAGKINGRYYVVKIVNVFPAAPKKMDEIKGQVIADYQDYLEKQWIEQLKVKYPVKIDESVVSSLHKKQ